MDEHEVEVEVQVKDIALDPSLNVPVVMLASKDGLAVLPIWIGAFEANAIALYFEGSRPARPMTHDLFLASLDALGARITKLLVSDLVDSTFLSLLSVSQGGRVVTIDSRPSDGIALALRAGAPIYVRRKVFEKASLQQSAVTSVQESPSEDEEGEGGAPPRETGVADVTGRQECRRADIGKPDFNVGAPTFRASNLDPLRPFP